MTENPLPESNPLGSSPGAEEAHDGGRPFLSAWSLSTPLSALSFWLAIALPALYLPLLITGLSSGLDLVSFLGLFALHLVALFGGRSYRRA